MKVMRS